LLRFARISRSLTFRKKIVVTAFLKAAIIVGVRTTRAIGRQRPVRQHKLTTSPSSEF
jgi:hypothetical protein